MAAPYQPGTDLIPCARCSTPVNRAQADYSETGQIVCAPCAMTAEIGAAEQRAVQGMMAVGYANLAIGAFALIFNPFLVLSIISIANAVIVPAALLRGTWYRQRMGDHFNVVIICAIIGGILGAVDLIATLLVLAASAGSSDPYAP